MTKRRAVLLAIKGMVEIAMGPFVEVRGLEDGDAPADYVPQQPLALAGLAEIEAGDPGEPEFTLSPLTYWYDHGVPLTLTAYGREGTADGAEQQLDAMLDALSATIEADRTLGGLCDWIDASSPETVSLFEEGARPGRQASITLTASYSTTSPL